MEYLGLYHKKCKTCRSLDPEESEENPKCHYEAGNTECPAAEVQIIIVGEAKYMAKAVIKARSRGDLSREALILQKVAKKSTAFQHQFSEYLK